MSHLMFKWFEFNSSANKCFRHIKTLWALLSGTNQPTSLDVIGPFIESAKDQLISGIQYFNPRAEESGSAASSFQTILSQAINLRSDQTTQLLDIYKQFEYRGTSEQFDNLLKNKHLHSGLLSELWQFYQKERLYLLHCIEFLIKKAHGSHHKYSKIFEGFLETYNRNDGLKKSLLAQLKLLSKSNPPQASGLVTTGMIKLWWNSKARETLLVLQSLIYYSEHYVLDADDLLEILSTCGDLPNDLEEGFESVWHLQATLLVKLIQQKDQ